MSSPPDIILGSQSPRRYELLAGLVGAERIEVVPPASPDEPGFDDVQSLEEVNARLREIARLKFHDVAAQLRSQRPQAVIVTADTIIVASDSHDRPVVLGKPPAADDALRATVWDWFQRYYAGRRHAAMSHVCVGRAGESPQEAVVSTAVWFRSDALEYVDWYIATGEPRGKAGGYAIQECGSLFVQRLEGSLSNVVGLPLVETLALLRAAGCQVHLPSAPDQPA